MRRLSLTILLFTLITVPVSAYPDSIQPLQDPVSALAGHYEAFFRQAINDEALPGAAFAVVTPDRIIRIATLGQTRLSGGNPVDEHTVFRLASVSKTFAAGLVAQLVHEQRLDWTDPVTRYVPAFRIDGDASAITIGHVLGQSAGLIPHAYDNLIEDGVAPERIMAKFAELEPLCAPGECYGYQNTVFNLVEPVVGEVAQSPYPALIEQRLFQPLGMDTASVGYEAFMATVNRAEPHVRRRGGWAAVRVKPNYYRMPAAAGVNASALDMAKWLRAQMGSHPEVLAPEMIDTLITPGVATKRELRRREWRHMLTGAHYGLGWRIYDIGGERLVYHGGWVQGFRADVAWSPRLRVGIAVLLNVETRAINTLTAEFWKMAIATLDAGPAVGAGSADIAAAH